MSLKNRYNIKTNNNSNKKFTKTMNKLEIVDTTNFFIRKIIKHKISQNNRILIDKYVKIQIYGNQKLRIIEMYNKLIDYNCYY